MNDTSEPRHFDLLSLDTQVVDQAGYAFDRGLLAQLRQFRGRRKRIVLADVVVREITGHVAQWLRAARAKLETARSELAKTGMLPKELARQVDLALSQDAQAEAESRVRRFIQDIGAEVISADLVRMGQLVDAYFAVTAPFAANKDKKAEFPDAIALLSLEAFAIERSVRILAVSKDSGWAAFGGKSAHIEVVGELSEALAIAQVHLQGEVEEEEQRRNAETAASLVKNFISDVESGADEDAHITLCTMLEDKLRDGGVEAETSGTVETDLDFLDIEVREATFTMDPDGKYAFRIVRAHPGSISATAELEVDLRARALFSMYGYDSIDKDTFSLGSRSVSGSFRREMSILMEFEEDPDQATLKLEKVEILGEVTPLDFGDVQPDWGPEHDP